MAGEKTYRVALVSCAMHQPTYAAGLAAHPRLEITQVVDEPGQIDEYIVHANRRLAEQYGVPYVEGIDRLLDDPHVDVCSVATQIERRGGVSAKLAAAGKHLFMDKPNAATLIEADAIVDAVRRSGVRTVVYGNQLSAAARRARRAISDGELGTVLALHWDLIFAKGEPGGVPSDWQIDVSRDLSRFTFRAEGADPSGSGHNVWAKRELHEIGLYPLGLVRSLANAEITTVYAQLGQYWLKSHAERGLEDFALMHLTFAGGATATITTGRYGRHTDPGAGVNQLRIVGTDGSFVLDGRSPGAMLYGLPDETGATVLHLPADDASGLNTLIDQFVECLDSGADTVNDAVDGRQQVEALLAGYASYFSGAPVQLPLPR